MIQSSAVLCFRAIMDSLSLLVPPLTSVPPAEPFPAQNIAVDKSYKTKVKVIVRNITPKACRPDTRTFAGPNQAACEHSGLASRSLAMPIRFPRLQTLSALFLLVTVTVATPLWAQKDAGAIVGLVRDPSGAVVRGAKVIVSRRRSRHSVDSLHQWCGRVCRQPAQDRALQCHRREAGIQESGCRSGSSEHSGSCRAWT